MHVYFMYFSKYLFMPLKCIEFFGTALTAHFDVNRFRDISDL